MKKIFENFIDNTLDNKSEDEIVNRWEKFCLLDGIEDELKKKYVALAMDKMAHRLLNDNKYKDSMPFIDYECIVFPIIRRVIMDEEYKEINDFDADFLEDIIRNCSICEILDGVSNKHYNDIINKGIYSKIKGVVGDKTMHDITHEDYRRYNDIDMEAEIIAALADYYVQRIKARNEREKEERTEMAQKGQENNV